MSNVKKKKKDLYHTRLLYKAAQNPHRFFLHYRNLDQTSSQNSFGPLTDSSLIPLLVLWQQLSCDNFRCIVCNSQPEKLKTPVWVCRARLVYIVNMIPLEEVIWSKLNSEHSKNGNSDGEKKDE